MAIASSQVTIRPGERGDLPAMVAIYNHYVVHTAITFDLEPYTVESRTPWFEGFATSGRYRLIVAELDGRTIGYACTMKYRPKAAYDTTVETSVYVEHGLHRRGVGAQLYGALFEAVKGEDIHLAYAAITLPNDASIGLHARMGFTPMAKFEEVGRKFGKYWDVQWMVKVMD